jgi:oligoendopeptidase F
MAFDPSIYEARRRALEQQYAPQAALASNARSNAITTTARTSRDLKQQYDKNLQPFQATFGKRGVTAPNVRSGAYRSGLMDFAKQRMQQESDLQQSMLSQLGQYDIQEKQALDALRTGNLDLESEKLRQIAEDAQIVMARRAGF